MIDNIDLVTPQAEDAADVNGFPIKPYPNELDIYEGNDRLINIIYDNNYNESFSNNYSGYITAVHNNIL